MRKCFTGRVFALCLAVWLTGCKSVQPPMPAESYRYEQIKPLTSILNLQADLEVARLEEIVNKKVDTLMYEDKSFADHGGDNLMVKAWKNGRIKMQFEDDKLYWELPLRLNIRKSVALLALNIPFADVMEATGEINLRFVTQLSINRDWSIKTETRPNGYDWVKSPSMKVAGISIPIKSLANVLLYLNEESYSKQIDKVVAGSFDLRQYAEKGWQLLFEPFKLPGDYNAWLSVHPYSVMLLPVRGTKGVIQFRTAITADVECLMDKVPESGKVTALPAIQPMEQVKDTFKVNLLTDIPYSTIEKMTMETVKDSVYNFDGKRIAFESFHVYGSDGKLAIETKVKGSVKGTVYLTGKPMFVASDTTLRIQDLKFDLKTKNVLLRSASWLFNGKVEKALTNAIAIPFNTDVQDIQKKLTGFFQEYPLGYGFSLRGKLHRLGVESLVVTPNSVKANMVFSGTLALGVMSDE